MFNKQKFDTMLINHKCSKTKLSKLLGMKSPQSIYRRIRLGGAFTSEEIRQMIMLFGKEEVLDCLFCCE